MIYHDLSSSLYICIRKILREKLLTISIAILHSNDIMPTNALRTMRFRQNSDLVYLSGIDQEETILVLGPDFPNEQMRGILFIRETNDHIATWEGHKYTKEEAFEASGIQNIQWATNVESVFNSLMALSDAV